MFPYTIHNIEFIETCQAQTVAFLHIYKPDISFNLIFSLNYHENQKQLCKINLTSESYLKPPNYFSKKNRTSTIFILRCARQRPGVFDIDNYLI